MFFSLRDKNDCTKNNTSDAHFDPRPKRGFNYLLTGAALFAGALIFISNPTASIAVVTNIDTNGTNASCTQTTYNTGSSCGSVTFPSTTSGSTASVTCPVGCSGTLTRSCSSSSWGTVSGSCVINRPVQVSGRKLLEDFDRDNVYAPYLIKGVVYNPAPAGRYPSDQGNPADPSLDNYLDHQDILYRDFNLLWQMHANTVYIPYANNREITAADVYPGSPWTTADIGRYKARMTQNTLYLAGDWFALKVIPGFDIGVIGEWDTSVNPAVYKTYIDLKNSTVRAKIGTKFRDFVRAFKTSPHILFWAIGSGNNLQLNPNDATQVRYYYMLMNQLAAVAHQEEGALYHPVAVVNGELYYLKDHNKYAPYVDIWGVKAYRGRSFTTLFKEYQTLSTKPLWITEFGVDVLKQTNNPDNGVSQEPDLQAQWLSKLWDEIVVNNNITVGGAVNEYMDQWWRSGKKDDIASNSTVQDITGVGPNDEIQNPVVESPRGSPFDQHRNDEWFGLMAIQPDPWGMFDSLIPRPAYSQMASKFSEPILPNNTDLSCEDHQALVLAQGGTPVPCEWVLSSTADIVYRMKTPKNRAYITSTPVGTAEHAYELFLTDYPDPTTPEAQAAMDTDDYKGARTAYTNGYVPDLKFTATKAPAAASPMFQAAAAGDGGLPPPPDPNPDWLNCYTKLSLDSGTCDDDCTKLSLNCSPPKRDPSTYCYFLFSKSNFSVASPNGDDGSSGGGGPPIPVSFNPPPEEKYPNLPGADSVISFCKNNLFLGSGPFETPPIDPRDNAPKVLFGFTIGTGK